MIDSLRLQNFRSYSDESFEFEPSVNIVVGPNASGKTNLLEAVLVLSRGGSYRARDAELIRLGKPWSRLDGYFGTLSRAVMLQRGPTGERSAKTFVLANKNYRRMPLERTVPVVFFEPNHLQALTRDPQHRREYFDDLLERTELGYKRTLSSYRRALAQRNALLKQGKSRAAPQLFAWDVRLSQLGEKIVTSRVRLVGLINESLSASYSRIAGKKTKASLIYGHQFRPGNYSSRMLAKLESNSRLDFERGFTTVGPHREDIELELNGQPISLVASRGEIRSLLLALKIFELGLVEKARDEKPIFLLDDVFSELDGARRRALVKYLKKYQAIITTTDADAVLTHFSGEHTLIPLS